MKLGIFSTLCIWTGKLSLFTLCIKKHVFQTHMLTLLIGKRQSYTQHFGHCFHSGQICIPKCSLGIKAKSMHQFELSDFWPKCWLLRLGNILKALREFLSPWTKTNCFLHFAMYPPVIGLVCSWLPPLSSQPLQFTCYRSLLQYPEQKHVPLLYLDTGWPPHVCFLAIPCFYLFYTQLSSSIWNQTPLQFSRPSCRYFLMWSEKAAHCLVALKTLNKSGRQDYHRGWEQVNRISSGICHLKCASCCFTPVFW